MDNVSISSVANKSKVDEKYRETSTFRSYASQIYAAFATNIVKFAAGSFLGFTSVMVAELYKEDAEIHMSISQLSWFSSFCFMGPIGCLFVSILAQRIGTRLSMQISTVFYFISYLVFYFATTAEMLLIAQAIAGLFFKIALGPGITYVVEITQSRLRSALTASTTLTTMFSIFLVVFLSNFLHWRTIALAVLVFPVLAFMAVCTIPESPHWLASRNELDKAEAALCWLRGWSTAENVTSEFNALKESYMSGSSENSGFPETQREIPSSLWLSFRDNTSLYLQRSFFIPLSLMCLLFALHACTGVYTLHTYNIVIFGHINAPIDAHVAASIFDAMRILGAIFCMTFIHYTGKKKLMYSTLTGAGLAQITSSAALLLNEYQIYPETCRWIASTAMMFSTFLSSCGIDKVVYILNAELFPTKYRSVGTGIGLFTAAVIQAASNKLFLHLWDAVTLPGVFMIYGITCIIICIMFYFIFPETEGKTLQEIQEHFEKKIKIDKVSTEASTLH